MHDVQHKDTSSTVNEPSPKCQPGLLPAPSLNALPRKLESARLLPDNELSHFPTSRLSLDWLQEDGTNDTRVLASCSRLILNSNGTRFQMHFQPQDLSTHALLTLAVKVGKSPDRVCPAAEADKEDAVAGFVVVDDEFIAVGDVVGDPAPGHLTKNLLDRATQPGPRRCTTLRPEPRIVEGDLFFGLSAGAFRAASIRAARSSSSCSC